MVQDEESDEEDFYEETIIVNEFSKNTLKKHNIYTYSDLYLYEREVIDFLNNTNRNDYIEYFITTNIHNRYIIKPIEDYTTKLIKNLIDTYKKEYKVDVLELLQLSPYTFERFTKLPKKYQFIYDKEEEHAHSHTDEDIHYRKIYINVNNNNTITYTCIDTEQLTYEEKRDRLEDFYNLNNIINTTTPIKHDTTEIRHNIQYGEYFEIQRKEWRDRKYYIEEIHAIKVLRHIYREQLDHLQYHYYDMERWDFNKYGYDTLDTITLLSIFITNRILKTITKHIKFYRLKKTTFRRIAMNKILRSKIYNYGLGLKLNIRNSGLELL
jgi:hypothetical protein